MQDTLAGIALRHVRELASECAGGRPTVDPFHFSRRGGQRGVGGLRGAVDDEAGACSVLN
jgi:hypothetical protein